jgi:hypothetical protein
LIVGIPVSNPAEGMNVVYVVWWAGSGIRDGLIIHSEKSYRLCVI